MKKSLLLLSGPIAVGKTAVRDELVANHRFDYVRSGRYLTEMANKRSLTVGRTSLQDLGDQLDEETDFHWLLDDVIVPALNEKFDVDRWIVDAVRKPEQVRHIRQMAGDPVVLHIHLTAPEPVLERRYETRRAMQPQNLDSIPYHVAVKHPNETISRGLYQIADEVYDTELIGPREIGIRVSNWFSSRAVDGG
jgi:adenylosuccinate synthase